MPFCSVLGSAISSRSPFADPSLPGRIPGDPNPRRALWGRPFLAFVGYVLSMNLAQLTIPCSLVHFPTGDSCSEPAFLFGTCPSVFGPCDVRLSRRSNTDRQRSASLPHMLLRLSTSVHGNAYKTPMPAPPTPLSPCKSRNGVEARLICSFSRFPPPDPLRSPSHLLLLFTSRRGWSPSRHNTKLVGAPRLHNSSRTSP